MNLTELKEKYDNISRQKMLKDKLIWEFENTDVTIPIDLEWNSGEGIFEMEEYLYDYIPSFDVIFDIHIRKQGYWNYGTYLQPPEFMETGCEIQIDNIEVLENNEGHRIENFDIDKVRELITEKLKF